MKTLVRIIQGRGTRGRCLTAPAFRAGAALVLGLGLAASAQGQGMGEAKGFKVAEHYGPPHEGQVKSMVQGARAREIARGQLLLTEVDLRTFGETNNPEVVIRAPQCVYDTAARTAGSPGTLKMETADGRFLIEGEGFLWQQTNSIVTISNRVHTVVQPEVMQGGGAALDNGAPPAKAIEIFSDRFDYNNSTGEGVYSGNMRVAGTNLSMAGGVLRVKVPMSERQLKSIAAEENVDVTYEGVRATGQRALYRADTEEVEMTGNPAWTAEQREGRAERIVIERTNKVFRALGRAQLRLPAPGGAGAGFIPRQEGASASAPGTNQFVDVVCDNYEIRTNWAVFRKNVEVTEGAGAGAASRMRCALMTVRFAGSNQVERLEAEEGVVIEQGDKLLTAGRAVYRSGIGTLELMDHPTWQAERRQGKGDRIVVNTLAGEMLVQSNASLRLPAADIVAPGQAAGVGGSRPAQAGSAEIFSEFYTLRRDRVYFGGGVTVSHPQMYWNCETMNAVLPPEGQERSLTGDGRVAFDLRDEKGQTVHGTGEKVVYTHSVAGAVTNQVVRMTGAPAVLQTASGIIRNDLILWDQGSGRLSTPGRYLIRMKTGVANAIQWPTNKFIR